MDSAYKLLAGILMVALEGGLIGLLIWVIRARKRFTGAWRILLITTLLALLLSPVFVGGHGLAVAPLTFGIIALIFDPPNWGEWTAKDTPLILTFTVGPFVIIWTVILIIYVLKIQIAGLLKRYREASPDDF